MDEDCTRSSLNQGVENLLAPPGFISRRAFRLRRVEQNENDGSIQTKKTKIDTLSRKIDIDLVEATCRQRPWILFNQNNEDSLEFEPMQHDVVNYFILFSLSSFWSEMFQLISNVRYLLYAT